MGELGEPEGLEEAGDADATLGTTASNLLALLCGRTDADPAAVAVAGDQALAATVLSGLGVTP